MPAALVIGLTAFGALLPLALAARRRAVTKAALLLAAIVGAVWLLNLWVVVNGSHGADGFIDCRPDACTRTATLAGWIFYVCAVVLAFYVLVALGGLLVRYAASRERSRP